MKSLFEVYQQMKEAAAAEVCPKCKKNPCECDSVEEELKGNQVKLDKNKNGKLDSDDFKKLRKEDSVPFDGPYTKSKGTVTDKSGAKHTGMSRARDLARKALANTQKKSGFEKYSAEKDKLKPKHFGMAEQFTEGYEEIKVHSKDGKHIGTITHGKYQSVAYAHPNSKFGGSKEPRDDEDSMSLKGSHDTQSGIDYIHAHHRMMSEEFEINESMQAAKKAVAKAQNHLSSIPEEFDQIDELSKDALKNYIPASAKDLSKKGISAGIDAKSGKAGTTKDYGDHFQKRYTGILRATRKLAKEEFELTLEDYSIDELEDYMMSEEFDQLDELSKSTLGSYVKKAAADATISRKVASDFEHMASRAKKPSMKASASELEKEYKSKSWKRRDNIGKAVDRLTKEEQMKTYSDLISQLDEYNSKEGVYRHKGKYGTTHDDPGVKSSPFWHDTEKDEDDEKPKKAAAPAVKRGRGRPAGAKSGARQQGSGSGSDYSGLSHHSLNLPNSNR
jgi:hypothetical protein